jgi:hypothetical protein
MRVLRQVTVLSLLVLSLGPVVSASAAGKAASNGGANVAAPVASATVPGLSTLLARIWRGFAGCVIDPLGGCFPGSQGGSKLPHVDAGCSLDPLGRCVPGSQGGSKPPSADAGCTADPLGGCTPNH